MGCADEAYEKAQLEFEDRKGKLTNELVVVTLIKYLLTQKVENFHIFYIIIHLIHYVTKTVKEKNSMKF